MLRSVVLALCFASLAAAPAFAQDEREAPSAQAPAPGEVHRENGRMVASNQCGAGQYAHLLGENYAEALNASLLPADSRVMGRPLFTSLEYTPGRLNVVLDVAGRIVAIGCF